MTSVYRKFVLYLLMEDLTESVLLKCNSLVILGLKLTPKFTWYSSLQICDTCSLVKVQSFYFFSNVKCNCCPTYHAVSISTGYNCNLKIYCKYNPTIIAKLYSVMNPKYLYSVSDNRSGELYVSRHQRSPNNVESHPSTC